MNNPVGKVTQKVAQNSGAMTPTKFGGIINAWHEQNKGNLELFMGDANMAMKLWLTVRNALNVNPKLMNATPASFVAAVMMCAQTKLFPGVAQECALVPLKGEVQWWPMYRGMIKSGVRARTVRDVTASVVYEADPIFDYEEGLRPFLKHKPFLGPHKDRGNRIAFYATYLLKDGTRKFELVDAQTVEGIKNRSPAVRGGASSAWTSDGGAHYDEMGKKTAIKRGFKKIPIAEELAHLLAIDDQIEVNGRHKQSGVNIETDLTSIEGYSIPGDFDESLKGGEEEPAPAEQPVEPKQLAEPVKPIEIVLPKKPEGEPVKKETPLESAKRRAKKEQEEAEAKARGE